LWERRDKVALDDLIFSEKYSEKSFNLQVEDRKDCIEALYNDQEYNPIGKGESAINIFDRYKDIQELFPRELKEKASQFEYNFDGFEDLRMQGQNKRFIHFLLARITKHIEQKSGIASNFETYTSREIDKPFQVEHIWSDEFEEHRDEFEQKSDFEEYRNRIGALLLLPEGFNQSYGALPYEKKLPHYYGQNFLTKSLNQQCYEKNPSFLKYITDSKLPFKSHSSFKKRDIVQRQELYRKICEEIWDLNEFDKIAQG